MSGAKLRALGYAPPVDAADVKSLRALTRFLENTKIRLYSIEQRGGLVSETSPDGDFIDAFKRYLIDLECHLDAPAHAADVNAWKKCIDWLLNKSLFLEYDDNSKSINQAQTSLFTTAKTAATPVLVDKDFKDSVSKLASILRIPPSVQNQDTLSILQSCANIIIRKFSPSALEQLSNSSSTTNTNNKQLALEDFHIGFTTNDALVDNAVRVLHLLHISDLRNLQTQVNALLTTLQGFTADPKTDASLGKVGR